MKTMDFQFLWLDFGKIQQNLLEIPSTAVKLQDCVCLRVFYGVESISTIKDKVQALLPSYFSLVFFMVLNPFLTSKTRFKHSYHIINFRNFGKIQQKFLEIQVQLSSFKIAHALVFLISLNPFPPTKQDLNTPTIRFLRKKSLYSNIPTNFIKNTKTIILSKNCII